MFSTRYSEKLNLEAQNKF